MEEEEEANFKCFLQNFCDFNRGVVHCCSAHKYLNAPPPVDTLFSRHFSLAMSKSMLT